MLGLSDLLHPLCIVLLGYTIKVKFRSSDILFCSVPPVVPPLLD